MDAQKYLQQLLETSSHYQLTEQDKSILEKIGLEDFIYSKLTNKKFRKYKMDDACVERSRKAIQQRIRKNQPIHIIYPQGGYKLWRFPSSPTADWAEFFNIAYVLAYVSPIAAAYPAGVQLTYYMHTLLMELHDNLTTEEIQAYVNSFESLLIEFRKYLPRNITISILRDADLYKREEYFKVLEEGKEKAEREYANWDQIKKDDFARMARLNIKWDGKEDWTNLPEKEKEEKIYLAALYEMAATSQLSKVAEIVKSSENVLVFTKASPAFIGIGSTYASIAKYWVGYGVLEKRKDSFLPIILTPSQYENAFQQSYEKVTITFLSSPNFSEIAVFNARFEFRKATKR